MPYGAITSGHGVRPVVGLELLGQNANPIVAMGIVDSGADESTIPIEYAARLGIDVHADCETNDVVTASGPTTEFRYRGPITALVLGEVVPLQASFLEGLPFVLLGRNDFFHHFKILFDQRARSFTLVTYD